VDLLDRLTGNIEEEDQETGNEAITEPVDQAQVEA
jgi:hypothetical protein